MSKRKGKKKKEIYFSEEDWKTIERKAAFCKLNTTKFIRKMCLEGEIIVYDFKAAHELIYEINKIGVNVNQIARKVNEFNSIYKSDIEKLQQEYENLCLMLNQYLFDRPSTEVSRIF